MLQFLQKTCTRITWKIGTDSMENFVPALRPISSVVELLTGYMSPINHLFVWYFAQMFAHTTY